MVSLMDEIVRDNLKVTLWGADQMGIGEYKSPVKGNNNVYDLDAGLGFAKSTKGKRKDWVWASTQAGAVELASNSDIVLIYSGKPEKYAFL